MTVLRFALSLLVGGCLLVAADTDTIKSESNLEKRADLAADNAYTAVERAATAYRAGKDDAYKSALTEVRESAGLCYKSLQESGKAARRSPKHFKRADARFGAISKKLDALAQEVSLDDRSSVQDLKKYVNDLQDKIVEQIMTKQH